jgi:hypothetical protein
LDVEESYSVQQIKEGEPPVMEIEKDKIKVIYGELQGYLSQTSKPNSPTDIFARSFQSIVQEARMNFR